ncbi:unnamed protein product [Cylicocyclus nassatus]|uniref:Metallo-beta-lactamase domain-containing protein 1 n=1 Tax=Cylicocyclus nassatus TaxID=53992 RepID=A0AA36MH01_CYLNA|nr:unnamed protein product [Cylicocyclus nassatus]
MLAVFILLHLQKALTAAFDNYPLQGEILRSLDDWERASLRDFVRGKGRGSVSRIPVELLNEPPPALDAMHEDNIVSLMTPPESAIHYELYFEDDRSVASVISPASKAQKGIKTSLDEPSQETFKELSGLLQTFIDRRKPLVQRDTTAVTLEQIVNNGPCGYLLKQNQSLFASNGICLLSNEENILCGRNPKPKVTILRNGSANQTNDGRYNFIATITLVQDNGKNILVDTGLGTDINGRTQLMEALEKQNLAAPSIHIVVTTHGHPDHAGGVHDFPDAIHYQGWYIHHRTMFNLSNLFENERHTLTDNVHLMRSTGHSSDDVAVVVMDEQTMGKVIIAGDTFMRREDLDYPMMWQPLSANETEQSRSRRIVICEAAWIVPGHGAPFQVTRQMREQFHC